jgi:hypothetical protein
MYCGEIWKGEREKGRVRKKKEERKKIVENWNLIDKIHAKKGKTIRASRLH